MVAAAGQQLRHLQHQGLCVAQCDALQFTALFQFPAHQFGTQSIDRAAAACYHAARGCFTAEHQRHPGHAVIAGHGQFNAGTFGGGSQQREDAGSGEVSVAQRVAGFKDCVSGIKLQQLKRWQQAGILVPIQQREDAILLGADWQAGWHMDRAGH